jgi:tetratricopeptide (TPR) repeat protein
MPSGEAHDVRKPSSGEKGSVLLLSKYWSWVRVIVNSISILRITMQKKYYLVLFFTCIIVASQAPFSQPLRAEIQSTQEIDSIRKDVELLKKEIDDSVSRPWYTNPSVVVSTLALLFSFGTTLVSYSRSQKDDVREARSELRGILQRLTSLPRDNFELIRKYKDDSEGQALSGFLTQENSLLARQASEIVDRFPDKIPSGEYYSVALALMVASDVTKVPIYFERALKQTSDPNVKVAVLRNYGFHLLNTGEVTEGRRKFEQALSIWKEYPNVTIYFKGSTDALTEMYWAQAEFGINNLEAAKEHIRKALQQVNSLQPGPMTNQLQNQVIHTQEVIEQGAPPDSLSALRPPGG